MMDFMRKTFLGAVLVLGVAAPAQAATFNTGVGGWTGNPSCNVTGPLANTSANIDVFAGANFAATFGNLDGAGNLCFNFNNTSSTAAMVTIASATVNQGPTWGFLNGVQLFSAQSGPAPIWTVAQGATVGSSFSFTIAALSAIFFDFSYGDPYSTKVNNKPQINFSVDATPVPVPAAGLLLLAALGGLTAMRRRKTV